MSLSNVADPEKHKHLHTDYCHTFWIAYRKCITDHPILNYMDYCWKESRDMNFCFKRERQEKAKLDIKKSKKSQRELVRRMQEDYNKATKEDT